MGLSNTRPERASRRHVSRLHRLVRMAVSDLGVDRWLATEIAGAHQAAHADVFPEDRSYDCRSECYVGGGGGGANGTGRRRRYPAPSANTRAATRPNASPSPTPKTRGATGPTVWPTL